MNKNTFYLNLLSLIFLFCFTYPSQSFSSTLSDSGKYRSILKLMKNGIKYPTIACKVKEDQNTYFQLSCDHKIDIILDLEGECYGESLEDKWGKDCKTYTRIQFNKENKQLNQKKGSYIILVNGEMEKREGSSICGSSEGFSLKSVNTKLKYASLISIEKICLTP